MDTSHTLTSIPLINFIFINGRVFCSMLCTSWIHSNERMGVLLRKYQILLTSVFILRKGYSPGEAIKSIPSSNRLKITRCRGPIFQSSSTV